MSAPSAASSAASAVSADAAAASSSAAPQSQSQAQSQPQAGFKGCSSCARSLHASAFSSTQAKAPAKSRKCMECVINSVKAAETAAATATPTVPAAAAAASTSGAKKSKANTPGAIARERAAARNPGAAAAAAIAASSSGKAPSAASIFSAPRRSKDQSGKELLLDEDEEWFLPAAEAALEEVFRRFDSAHPMPASASVHRDSLSWTVADLQRFAMATNGRLFTTEELVEVQDNLEHNEQGQLTLQGFLDLFHLQTTAHPDETWKDLKKLGYNEQLQLTK